MEEKVIHDCKQEDLLREMHGDIKMLVTEFKAMNGSLRRTKEKFEKHEAESVGYRDKVTVMWATTHTLKWAIVLLFGSGIVWQLIGFFITK